MSTTWNGALAAALIDDAEDAIVARRLDGTCIRWNEAAARLFGYSAEDMLGHTMQRLMPADIGADDAGMVLSLMHGSAASHYDTRRVRKDGSVAEVTVTVSLVRDASGTPMALSEIYRDNTARKATESALRASEEFLDRAGKIAGVGGWSLTIGEDSPYWSDQVCRIHEVEVGTRPSLEQAIAFYAPAARDTLSSALQRCIADGTPFDLELPFVTACGRRSWVRATGELDRPDGRPARIFGTLQDITARRAAQANLQEQHELMRITLDSISDAVITTDSHALVRWLNPAAARITAWTPERAHGRPIEQLFRLVNEQTREPVMHPVRIAIEEGRAATLPDHTLLVAHDGREYAIQDSAAPMLSASGRSVGVVMVFRDVSSQRILAREVSYRASRDPLTGTFNRSEFELRLKRALTHAHTDGAEHALMFLDLDQFKVVNDTCGHAAGDEMLRQLAEIFQTAIRHQDTLARLGGDEFGLIMENCTTTQARRVAEQLCKAVDRYRYVHEGRSFRVGASIGLVPIDRRWSDITRLMQAADDSCYAAKEAGRRRVHEWIDSDQRAHQRQGEARWVTRIEHALDQGRLRLYAQRIVPCSAPDSGLTMEVLLRLIEPDGSIIPASAFLPAAERFHIASRIDRWVIAEVLQRLRRTPAAAFDMLTVNLSGQSLSDRRFCHEVATQIASGGFDTRKLCFEITETAAITHMEAAREFVDVMHEHRVRIALDDFGAGASSFGYLKKLKIDYLKIDGQFVRDLLDSPLDQTAVRCFCDVAAVCKVRAIAESVESAAVLAELNRIGVDYAQGYMVHAPEPLDELLAAHAIA